MKVIDLLNKMANDTLANGTKIIIDNKLYIYNQKSKHLELGTDRSEYRIFNGADLNKIVDVIPVMEEIIEEEKEIEELPLLANTKVRCEDDFLSRILTNNNKEHNELINKINELVREVNNLKKEGK